MPGSSPPAIFLMGPTASGKTGLAAELVEKLPCDIISVDSAMIYRGMDIGTAKPSREVLESAPHRLIDILDPAASYSAGQFRTDALEEMRDIAGSGRVPLLVGGTMLYFRVLLRGLADLPDADPDIRSELNERAAEHGWPALHAQLGDVDPEAAARIHPNDAQRIQRALEVYSLSGQPMTVLQRHSPAPEFPYRVTKIAVAPPREALHRTIEARFRQMIANGLVEEVERLYRREDLHRDKPSMRAVGYRQIWDYLCGAVELAEARRAAVAATRQLAKRQMTWLRAEPDLNWHDSLEQGLQDRVFRTINRALG